MIPDNEAGEPESALVRADFLCTKMTIQATIPTSYDAISTGCAYTMGNIGDGWYD